MLNERLDWLIDTYEGSLRQGRGCVWGEPVELQSFHPRSVSPQVVSPQLRVVSPQLKVVSPQLKVVSPQLKVVSPRPKISSPEGFLYVLESNKRLTWTKEALFTLQVKAVEGPLSFQVQLGHRSIRQQTLFDFTMRVQQNFWSTRIIKQIHIVSMAL